MKTTLRCIISIVLIAYIMVAVAWARMQASTAVCSGVEIAVSDTLRSQFVTPREIANEIGGLPLRPDSVLLRDINTDSIERVLSRIDKIEDVNCVITSGGKVRITVEPLLPVARIFDGNTSYYINKAGKRISASARYHSDVPVISGHFDSTFRPRELLPLVYYLNADSAWNSLVTHIKADNPRNIILVPIIHGHVINLGDLSDLDNKFYRLTRAYREILPVKGWDFYDTLSVKWGGQLVATRRAKKLHHAISAIDFEAEHEEPDVGTMLSGDTAGQVNKSAIGLPPSQLNSDKTHTN